jgi:hypothetical protein
MKSKPLLVLFLICFSLFLFLGYKASQAVFSEGAPSLLEDGATSGPVLLEEQPAEAAVLDPFTLIIFVDDLMALNPNLEGVWLSRAADGGAGALFFPIFPSQATDGAQRDINLRGAFWLEESLILSVEFQTILRDRNLSWHQVLLLDQTALSEINLILAEINPEYIPLNSVGLSGLNFSVENRLLIQGNQALFIHDLCSQLPLPAHNELVQRVLEGFTGHLVFSGTTPVVFIGSWSGVSYCLFPTMTLPTQ